MQVCVMILLSGRDAVYRELEFRNDVIPLVEVEGQVYVIAKGLVQQLGLDWKSQYVKLCNVDAFGTVKIELALTGQIRTYTCIPLLKFHDFLCSINWRKIPPNKLADVDGKLFSVRRKVRVYEDVFLRVLDDNHKGFGEDIQTILDVYQES